MSDPSGAEAATEGAKKAMRAEMRARTAAIRPFARGRRSAALCAAVLRSPPLAGAKLVLAYRAMRDEIDADGIVRALAARRVRVAFPSVRDDGGLDLLEIIGHGDPLAPEHWAVGRFGIATPRDIDGALRRVHPREVDVVLVPGRAFDARGARLGRGKGFYDGLLARLRPDARGATVGLCYREQLVDCVPEAPHDRRVAFVACEGRFLRAGPARRGVPS